MIAIEESGEGEPLVLLHGVGANRLIWSQVRPLLADRHVLAPDLPGFGNSPATGPEFDLESCAATLADRIAERAGQPFDLLGNSLGGAVALQLAVRRPDLVRCLILSAPAGFTRIPAPLAELAGRLSGPALAYRRIVGVPLAGNALARRVLLGGALARPQDLAPKDARAMLRASGGSTRIGSAVTTVLRSDLSAVLGRLDAPLGIIWGRHDRVVPTSTLQVIYAVRPHALTVTLDEAGHIPQVERPAEFVAAVRRIIRRLTSPGTPSALAASL